MNTLYYRKIAEIVRRDEANMAMLSVAARALLVGRAKHDKIAKGDRRALKEWMLRWCDAKALNP